MDIGYMLSCNNTTV